MAKNTKTTDKKIHGRKVSGIRVAIIIVTALLLLVAILLTVLSIKFPGFIEAIGVFLGSGHRPNVDDDAHFTAPPTNQSIDSRLDLGLEKYHIVKELRYIKEGTESFMKSYYDLANWKRTEGVYNFLILGRDKVALNTDVIMIMNFNTGDGSINIMQLPRDTYIEFGGYPNKINGTLAHFYTEAQREGVNDPWHTALKNFSDLLENAFSIQIDYYAIIDLAAFENVVDIIGGVPIYVPDDMHYDDIYQNLSIHINKGYQVLDGKTAAGFVRFRSGYVQADIGRQNAQKLFLTALFKQVKASFSVDTVTKLVDEVLSKMSTNLTLADAAYFAKEALGVDLENINMMTVPGEAIMSGLSYYVVYSESVIDVVNKYFNVYEREINAELFDRQALFTDGEGTKIDSIYSKKVDGYTVNNGESIDGEGIYIPRLPDEEVTEAQSEPAAQSQTVTEKITEKYVSYEDETEASEDISEAETDTEVGTEEADTSEFFDSTLESQSDFDTQTEEETLFDSTDGLETTESETDESNTDITSEAVDGNDSTLE